MLSQTFLAAVEATEVLIPMVSWPIDAGALPGSSGGGGAPAGADAEGEAARAENLETMLKHSPFRTEKVSRQRHGGGCPAVALPSLSARKTQ
eukprot:SAG22_NODE_745_length_7499_cov_2.796622_2_plen_92_part_00